MDISREKMHGEIRKEVSADMAAPGTTCPAGAGTPEINQLRRDLEQCGNRLADCLSMMRYQRDVHESLARAAASGAGVRGIAHAVHDLTGHPALVEDQFGNLCAWSGHGRPDPYPKPDPVRHRAMMQEALRGTGPSRQGDRLISPVRYRGETLGLLALSDPGKAAGDREAATLDHATTFLALELARLRSLAELELRLRRELVEDLLDGTDEASAFTRSDAVGHDLHRPHFVVAVEWSGGIGGDALQRIAERSAAHCGLRTLLARRSDQVVLVSQERPTAAFYQEITQETGTDHGAIGVSGRCDSPRFIPRGYREAVRALEVRRGSHQSFGTTFFDDLGLYRILAPGNDSGAVEEFVREWLGELIDYDSIHRTALVETLSQYFECGGNYDDTAGALTVHRSTLRYRLQRIREISGCDLSSVENRLNLQVATRVWKVVMGAPP